MSGFYERNPDWHAVISIQLGELIEGGLFDWENDESIIWDFYNEEQYKRVCQKFVNRYFYREIGIVPYRQWKLAYLRRMNEIMPKFKPLYEALNDGADILSESDEWSKSRSIFSDFPATMLGDNQDYASTGNDQQSETIRRGDWIETVEKIKYYDDVDAMILNELEPLFSSLLTASMNGI